MKITSLKYTPANQNYKGKQQDSPTFRGMMTVIAKNVNLNKTTKKRDLFWTILEKLMHSIAAQTGQTPNYISMTENRTTSFILKFSPVFDKDAIVLTTLLNKKYSKKGIYFRFTKGEEEFAN